MREAERRSLLRSIYDRTNFSAREGDERTKALLLLALLDRYQSKPMRVNMKEPVELEPIKKIDEIRRFSNKKMRLTKESIQ